MRILASLLMFLCLTSFIARPVAAQQSTYQPEAPRFNPEDYDITSNPQYDAMAFELLSKPEQFDFVTFRGFYSRTRQYDPLATDTKEKMLQLAYTAQMDPDKAKRAAALKNYDDLVFKHLASIDVVNLALVLARGDKRLGDTGFFEWLRRKLTEEIVGGYGDGATLQTAYEVIAVGEETTLLKGLKVNVLKTDARQAGHVYYNMHEVEDAHHTGPYTVFVNTTIPMAWLERHRPQTSSGFAIPKQ